MKLYVLVDTLKNGDEFMGTIAAPDDAVAISGICDIINRLSDNDYKKHESFAVYWIPESEYLDYVKSGYLRDSNCVWYFKNEGNRPGYTIENDEIDVGIDPAYL